MRLSIAVCLAVSAACTPTPSPAPAADCAAMPNVIRLSPRKLVIRSGLRTDVTVPAPGSPREIVATLRQKQGEHHLRPACSGEPDVLDPAPRTPIGDVVAAVSVLKLAESGLLRVRVGDGKPPLAVLGQRWRLPTEAELREQSRCSEVRLHIKPDRIQLQRYPHLTNSILGQRLSHDLLSRDPPKPVPSIDREFVSPNRVAEMLEVLDAPHFDLPNCEVARLGFHGSFRWGEARVLANAFHEAQPLQILIDADPQ